MESMEWVKLQTLFNSEKQALKTANIVATTEARLSNQKQGPQFEVETRVEPIDGKWQVSWRKVFIGNKSGCGGGCQSCGISEPPIPKKHKATVIPFRKVIVKT